MLRFVVDRLVRLVLVLVAITIVSFLFMHAIPGDPIALRLGDHASAVEIAHLRASLGLDRPWPVQLGLYMAAVAHGDLGQSIFDSQPVAQKLGQYFPATVELTLSAMLFAIVVGIPAGVIAAVRHRTALDALTMSAALLGVSIPVFWLGWILVYLLSVLPSQHGLNLFPISGRIAVTYFIPARTHLVVVDALLAGNGRAALDALWHLILPAVTLGTIPLAIVAKITRSGMLDVLSSDYIRTARAKGLDQRAVVIRHALRNALIPIITVLGLQTGLLLGGAVLTESVFAWPGVGRLAFEAISNRDMPLINGCILLFATVFVVVNAIVDLLYAAANPRIRFE
ncbi:MAG: binding--dependent transport system inner rane component family protein [Candidatus Eremiobacteraeota bacterium]|nr:binding--dependent transport system inner rane component family protein [Candidatus Eremiobacteraeota bacterium]